jgi:hypothetical protein
MKGPTFNGYAKPTLAVRDGAVKAEHVPVPHLPFYARWLSRSAEGISQLRTSQLIHRAMRRGAAQESDGTATDSLTWEVAAKVFADLDSLNRAKQSVLVLVFLPTQLDRGTASGEWRRRVHELSAREHIALVDLVADFERLPPDSSDQLFLGKGEAAGHYTAVGNEWVATQLYRHLLDIPEVAGRLEQLH